MISEAYPLPACGVMPTQAVVPRAVPEGVPVQHARTGLAPNAAFPFAQLDSARVHSRSCATR